MVVAICDGKMKHNKERKEHYCGVTNHPLSRVAFNTLSLFQLHLQGARKEKPRIGELEATNSDLVKLH